MRLRVLGLAMLIAAMGANPAAAAEPVRIRVSRVVSISNWASILLEKPDLAHHQGKSYVMEATRYNATSLMISAMATGELDIGTFAYSSFALAIENARIGDLKIISDQFQDGAPGHYTDEFFVLKDSPIKTIADLKGKVLATNAAGSAVDIAMRAILRRNGIDDKRDVTIVETAFGNMPAMLKDGKVVIFPGVLPFSMDPEVRKITRVLFTQKEAVGTTQMIIWAARDGFIKQNRAAMIDFMEDALRAQHWYLDPANHAEVAQVASRISGQPPANFDWLTPANDYYQNPNGEPNLDALQSNIDLQKELGFLKTGFDVKQYADLSIVKAAARRFK